MGVVDERGILGRVVLTSAHYCRVISYLNTDFRVAAKVQPLQAFGIVRWDGDRLDRLLMEHVIRTEPVEKGHLVVTSGYSEAFPEGYPIGEVDSVYAPPGENQLTIYLIPTAPLNRAEHAFVLLHHPEPERTELEAEY
jgi:rod shape-determining protein MreC